jgi:hypothetical protein
MRSLSSQLRGRLWIANTYWTESVMKSKAARPRMDVDLEELDGIIDGALRAPLRGRPPAAAASHYDLDEFKCSVRYLTLAAVRPRLLALAVEYQLRTACRFPVGS